MRNPFLFFLGIQVMFLFFTSCKKGAGIGGEATIKGHVTGILYNKYFTAKIDSGAVPNWSINILYEGDVGVDASQKTDYNGAFEFQYLREGNYTIFLYSRARKSNLPDSSIVVKATITGKTQVLNLPEIKILR